MMILLTITRVLIPIVLSLVVVVLLYDWKKTKSQNESEGNENETDYKRSKMAWFIKTILNYCFIFFIASIFVFAFFLAREVYNEIQYKEPLYQYSLPITFQVISENLPKEISANHTQLKDWKIVVITNAQGEFNIRSRTAAILFYTFITINLVYVLTVLHQLRKFLQALSIKQPFIKDNARRLRIVAGALIVCELLQGVVCSCCNTYVDSLSELQHFEIISGRSVLNLEIVFFGFILIVIAEAFRCGAELKEENDLTV